MKENNQQIKECFENVTKLRDGYIYIDEMARGYVDWVDQLG